MADLRRTLQAIATAVPPGIVVPPHVLEARRRQRDQQRQRIPQDHFGQKLHLSQTIVPPES
jgi:hypothetical protein